MNLNCARFIITSLKPDDIQGKRVLEVGSFDVNGSVRPFVQLFKPAEYIGIDISEGRGVDVVCDATDIVRKFGANSFDLVLSTELLEHIRDWRKAIDEMKAVCRPGGVIAITTRSKGFPYHGYPFDYWRYESEDIEYIFGDCAIEAIEKDPDSGIFAKIRKPSGYVRRDLSGYALYTVLLNRRAPELKDRDLTALYARWAMMKPKLRTLLYAVKNIFSWK